jgi:hypothetical protein
MECAQLFYISTQYLFGLSLSLRNTFFETN